jgi:hypothetical protein
MKTPAYIQIVGFIDNTAIDLDPSDSDGKLDLHGADLQGNPLVWFTRTAPRIRALRLSRDYNIPYFHHIL